MWAGARVLGTACLIFDRCPRWLRLGDVAGGGGGGGGSDGAGFGERSTRRTQTIYPVDLRRGHMLIGDQGRATDRHSKYLQTRGGPDGCHSMPLLRG